MFEVQMKSILCKIKSSELQQDIHLAFKRMIREVFEEKKSIQQVHQERIGSMGSLLSILSNTCSYYFLRTPSYNLTCNHRLCSSCVSNCGLLVEPGLYRVRWYPCCNSNMVDKQPLSVMPLTAGSRVLHLTGSNSNMIFQFLKDMEPNINLPNLPLRKFFNVIIAFKRGKSCPSLVKLVLIV